MAIACFRCGLIRHDSRIRPRRNRHSTTIKPAGFFPVWGSTKNSMSGDNRTKKVMTPNASASRCCAPQPLRRAQRRKTHVANATRAITSAIGTRGNGTRLGTAQRSKKKKIVVARAIKRNCHSRGALRVEGAWEAEGFIRSASQTQATASATAMKYDRGGCV